MKNLILGALLMIVSVASFAAAPGGPNCGWGNLLFQGQSGLPSHVVAYTTNATGNATFGMTSGTNGCAVDNSLTYGGKSVVSIGEILDEFSEDVARGEGEALTAVAVSIGIEASEREEFKALMHSNFDKLFPSSSTDAEAVFNNMLSVMRSDSVFAKYVS